jgi:hypothetical protein
VYIDHQETRRLLSRYYYRKMCWSTCLNYLIHMWRAFLNILHPSRRTKKNFSGIEVPSTLGIISSVTSIKSIPDALIQLIHWNYTYSQRDGAEQIISHWTPWILSTEQWQRKFGSVVNPNPPKFPQAHHKLILNRRTLHRLWPATSCTQLVLQDTCFQSKSSKVS